MVTATVQPEFQLRGVLLGVSLLCCWTTVAPVAYAADSNRLSYDWEQPVSEPGYRKPSTSARNPVTSVPAPPARERWKKPTPEPKTEVRIDQSRPVEASKPIEPVSLPQRGAATVEAVTSTGPQIVGRVIYRGLVPAPVQVEVDRDTEICGNLATVTPLSVDPTTHGVRDAIVHVGVGQEMTDSGPLQVSVVQNKHCAFLPRVAAVRSGAETQISNGDPVMHNTNMTLNSRTVLNVALVAGGNPVNKPLKREGLHLIKCNVHKFMQAYRYVFNDPFFNQTNETGQFRITGLPPGLHAVSVWHETLGVLHKEVEVPIRGTVTVDFEYK